MSLTTTETQRYITCFDIFEGMQLRILFFWDMTLHHILEEWNPHVYSHFHPYDMTLKVLMTVKI